MIYQVERIEEGSRCIFAKLFQCFHIHFKMWQLINQSGFEEKSPIDNRNKPLESLYRIFCGVYKLLFPSGKIHLRNVILLFPRGITLIPKTNFRSIVSNFPANSYSCREWSNLPKSFVNSHLWNGRTTLNCNHFPNKVNYRSSLSRQNFQ